MKKKNNLLKKILLSFLCVVLALVLVVGSYAAYVFIDYDRIDDNLTVKITDNTSAKVPVNKELKAISYNIGFCAYTQDFSFFMDGGTESRAKSKESVTEVLSSIDEFVASQDADFVFFEEVDEDATRSHHVNQRAYLTENAPLYDSVFAVNFDSAYLFYPVFKPHGKSLSGLLTQSRYDIKSSIRRSLPVEDSVMKIVDLDRCYSVSRLDTENGKELVLYTVHLSAYTSDGTIATKQLELLVNDMQKECENGNYVVCGGDFNKDLLQQSGEIFGVSGEDYTWTQAFPLTLLEGTSLSLVAPYSKETDAASCRDTKNVYSKEGQFNITLDGFIVSDNVSVTASDVIDLEFKYSDHNPVYLNFTLIN